jgi:hypothetical protein
MLAPAQAAFNRVLVLIGFRTRRKTMRLVHFAVAVEASL